MMKRVFRPWGVVFGLGACGVVVTVLVRIALAAGVLLTADGIAGQAYNCYDRYIADQDVARIARDLAGSGSRIEDLNKGPKHQIETGKIRALGMTFGGQALLEKTVRQLIEAHG